MIVPDIVIAGAAKCGTSSLFDWLGQHPSISPSIVSEPGYFTDEIPDCFSVDDYFNRFFPECVSGTLTLEADPFNLFYPPAAKAIFEVNPNAKIIISVRKPTVAVYSWYWHHQRISLENRSFEEVIFQEIENEKKLCHFRPISKSGDYLRRYNYPQQIKRFKDLFGDQNVFVFPFCMLKNKPLLLLHKLEQFIGIERFDGYVLRKLNPSQMQRHILLRKLVAQLVHLLHKLPMKTMVSRHHRNNIRSMFQSLAFKKFTYPPMQENVKEILDLYFQKSWQETSLHFDIPAMDAE